MNLLTSSLLLPEQTSLPSGRPHHLVLRSPVNQKTPQCLSLSRNHNVLSSYNHIRPFQYVIFLNIQSQISENSTHKDHSTSSLTETKVLKPVLLVLVLAESLFDFWPVLRVAVRGTRGQRGTRAREGWLSRKGLQSLLSLFISLSAWYRKINA